MMVGNFNGNQKLFDNLTQILGMGQTWVYLKSDGGAKQEPQSTIPRVCFV